jgi:choline dehydrogenase-like flavoprotein
VSQIRDGFNEASPGGTVTLRSDRRGLLDYPITEYIRDGIRSSYLSMAECQFAAGAATVTPANMDAQPYTTWAEARAAIASLSLRSPNTVVNSTHPLGGCAMGEDPRISVVNSDGWYHHLQNLAVIDGSTFPTSVGVNPGLSIYALAARQATTLVVALGRQVPEEYR